MGGNKRMKKSTILSALTVAMITVSTVTTYAIWDITTVTSKESIVTMREPVVIEDTTSQQYINIEADTLNPKNFTARGTVIYNVRNDSNIAKSITLKEIITASELLVETTDYSIEFTGSGISGKTGSAESGAKIYDYTITFTESGLSKIGHNSNECTVKVNATLQ